jgi:hypothetical protein
MFYDSFYIVREEEIIYHATGLLIRTYLTIVELHKVGIK